MPPPAALAGTYGECHGAMLSDEHVEHFLILRGLDPVTVLTFFLSNTVLIQYNICLHNSMERF